MGVGRGVCRLVSITALSTVVGGFAATAAAESRRVPAGGNLQAVLDAAQPGDVILLAAGATYSGNFVLRKKIGEGFITLQTEIDDVGPLAPGTRITPAAAAKLAKLRSPNSSPALQTAPQAHHWRIQLLQFGPTYKGYGEIIRLGDGSADQHTLDVVPHTLVIDRVYVFGDPLLGQKRGIAMNAANVTVINSHISDIKAIGQDSQALGGWNGPGPFVVENNYLEAAAENFLLGGSSPEIPSMVPTGLTFRRNHLSRPLSWRDPIVPAPTAVSLAALSGGALPAGAHTYQIVARRPAGQTTIAQSSPSGDHTVTIASSGSVRLTWAAVPDATEYGVYRTSAAGTVSWTTTATTFTDNGTTGAPATPPLTGSRWLVKNIFELKNARNIVIEHNLFENNWQHGQAGYAIVFTVRNSSGLCTWCRIENVEFRYNIVRHVAGGVNILGYDSPEVSQQGRNIRITHNLFHDVDGARWGGAGVFLLMGDEPRDVLVDHNTIDHAGATLVSVYGGSSTDRREIYGFKFTNNLARHGKYGIFGAGSSSGFPTLQAYLPDAEVTRNLLSEGLASRYPVGNFFSPVFETQFVNAAAADFRLIASSPFRLAATDGSDLGVDLSKLQPAFDASSGTPTTSPTEATPPVRPIGLRIVTGRSR
jgi:hypothetical protein